MRYITSRKQAEGLGSARSGTAHHIAMTVSGWALLVLVPLWIFAFARVLGHGYDHVVAAFGNPFMAILTALLLVVGLRHFAKGVQTVVEDYCHGASRTAFIMAANAVSYVLIAAGLFALVKLAL